MLNSIAIILIVLLYFTLKAVKDTISFHFMESIFSKLPIKYFKFIDPSISWKNKWKNGDVNQGERFIRSSTIFVMFTDLWHLCDFLQSLILCVIAIFAIFKYGIFIYLGAIGLFIIGSLLFELLYSIIFKK